MKRKYIKYKYTYTQTHVHIIHMCTHMYTYTHIYIYKEGTQEVRSKCTRERPCQSVLP